mgnify:CR=1 FL=1
MLYRGGNSALGQAMRRAWCMLEKGQTPSSKAWRQFDRGIEMLNFIKRLQAKFANTKFKYNFVYAMWHQYCNRKLKKQLDICQRVSNQRQQIIMQCLRQVLLTQKELLQRVDKIAQQ